jgi:tape measure domain-containing protein
MTSIAQAYVEILPSTRGMGRALQGQMGGVESTLGNSSRRGFLGGLAGVGGAMVGAIGVAGIVGAGAAIGSTLSRGLTRSLNLQDARAQLTGLGHDAEGVEAVMASALDSVSGTAFGLDAAATTAASAVAAGVEPGADLTRMLSLVADAATIAGTDMGSMGSIFNKVASGDMIQGEVLAQLGDRGIPVLQFLADELGVTAGEVRDMASRGEIDFATFQSAMETGLGGAALASGDTARGAFANVGAAVGRLGALFTGGAVEGAPGLFQSMAGAVDRLAEALTPVAESINGAIGPAFENLAGWIDGIDFTNIGGLLEGGSALRDGLFNMAMGALPGLLEGLVSALPQVASFVAGTLIPQLVSQFSTLVTTILDVLTQIIPQLAAMLPGLVQTLLQMVPALITSLLGAVPQLLTGALAFFMALLDALVLIVPQLLTTIVEMLPVIVQTLVAMLPTLIDAAINFFFALITALLETIPVLLVAIIGMLPDIVTTLVGLVPVLVEAAIQLFSALLDGLLENLPLIIDMIVNDMIPAIVGAIIEAAPQLLEAGVSLIQAFIDGIGSMLGAVGDAVGGIVDFVAGFFPNSPAHHGPLSGAGWRAIGHSGSAIEDQFSAGFTGRIDDVISSGVQVPRLPMSAEVAGYAAAQGGGVNVNIHPSQPMDAYLVGRIAGDEVAHAMRGMA